MARQRKLTPEKKALISQLIQTYQPEDVKDVQDMLKDLLGDTIQGMLKTELEDKLGYSKYDYNNKDTDNSRYGYSKKTVTSSIGDIDLDIPHDRNDEFKPQIVKKNLSHERHNGKMARKQTKRMESYIRTTNYYNAYIYLKIFYLIFLL